MQASPDNPLIYNLLGKLWVLAKDTSQAEAAFKSAIEANDAIPVSYINLADLYLRTSKVDQAIQEYQAALAKNPKLVSAHMVLGIIYDQRKEYGQAKSRYEEALKLNPKSEHRGHPRLDLLQEHDLLKSRFSPAGGSGKTPGQPNHSVSLRHGPAQEWGPPFIFAFCIYPFAFPYK